MTLKFYNPVKKEDYPHSWMVAIQPNNYIYIIMGLNNHRSWIFMLFFLIGLFFTEAVTLLLQDILFLEVAPDVTSTPAVSWVTLAAYP